MLKSLLKDNSITIDFEALKKKEKKNKEANASAYLIDSSDSDVLNRINGSIDCV